MKKTKVMSAKRSFFMSVLSLILCFAMLLGTTWAWFTDEVTSGVNQIKAGNLDVEVEYINDTTKTWTNLQGTATAFSKSLWEPGHTEFVTLKIVNKGTLALNYKAIVSPVSESGGINAAGAQFKLSDYLVFATTAPSDTEKTYTDRAAARADAGTAMKFNQAGLTQKGTLYPDGDTTGPNVQYLTLVVYMPETVGNEANYMTGTTPPEIDLGITVLATQKDHEPDSFDNQYDKFADLTPDKTGKDALIYDYFPQVRETAQIIYNTEVTAVKADGNNVSLDANGNLTIYSEQKPDGTAAAGASDAAASVSVKLNTSNTNANGSLTLNVIKDDAANANFSISSVESGNDDANRDKTTYEVNVKTEGVVPFTEDNRFTVNMFIGKNLKNVAMYHDVNNLHTSIIPMTDAYASREALINAAASTPSLVDAFYYDLNTGYVTMVVDKFSPFTSVYDKAVAVIGTTRYYSLESAFEAAQAGETITMIQNVKQSNSIIVDKNVTLDLAGKTITDENWAGVSPTKQGFFYVKSGAKLTVNDSAGTGTITTTNEAIYGAIIMTIGGDGNNDANNDAVLVVNGGTLCGYYYGVVTNGDRHNTDITINGGTLTGSNEADATSIYHPCQGKLTINGGTLKGYDGLAVKGGTINITGGKFIATGNWNEAVAAQGSGSNSVGAALYVEGNYGYAGKVNVSGGEFIAQGNNGKAVYIGFNEDPKANISLTGGTFSSDPTAYVADGYKAVDNGNGTWTVRSKSLDEYFTGGSGTENDPFLIANLEQFENISYVEKYSYFKWVGEKSVDASDLSDTVYLCGSFDGDGVTFNNLKKFLFRAVWNGSESWNPSEDTTNTYTVSNLTVNANIVTDGWIAAVVRVAGVHNFVMDNVTVHGYVEGATGVASFVCFGPGNYAPTSYTYDGNITFRNCNSDATLVAKSGNAVGFIAHPMMATSAGRITLENSNYSGDMSATSAGGCKYVSGNWINAIITDNQSETKNNTTYNSGANGWTYIAENKTGTFTVEQQNKPETIGNVFTVTAKESATRATFALQISPDPGNFTSTYLVEEVNVANNSFTSEKVKYFEVKVNAEGATETGAAGNVYHVVNPIYGNSLGSNTIVRVTQYDSEGKILGITTINFHDKS